MSSPRDWEEKKTKTSSVASSRFVSDEGTHVDHRVDYRSDEKVGNQAVRRRGEEGLSCDIRAGRFETKKNSRSSRTSVNDGLSRTEEET